MPKICLIADTHEQHEQVAIPACEILIHAGDLTGRGGYSQTQKAIRWLDAQPAQHVVCIAGNHDFLPYRYPDVMKEIVAQTRVIYLENSQTTISGLKIWGSPQSLQFMDWAFMSAPSEIHRYWDQIPEDTDILITHGPPFGVLDRAHPSGPKLGDEELAKTVNRIQPKIHVFGHVHGGYGRVDHLKRQSFNASVVNEAYKIANKPHEVEL